MIQYKNPSAIPSLEYLDEEKGGGVPAPAKLTRKTVFAAVKEGGISGCNRRACAVAVVARLKLDRCCTERTLEILQQLFADGLIVHRDTLLRPTTVEERADLQAARISTKRRKRATRARTADKRTGGFKNLPVAV